MKALEIQQAQAAVALREIFEKAARNNGWRIYGV
jgi:hypothetical protein